MRRKNENETMAKREDRKQAKQRKNWREREIERERERERERETRRSCSNGSRQTTDRYTNASRPRVHK